MFERAGDDDAVTEDIKRRARELISRLQGGAMGSIAYDTSWVARLKERDGSPKFPTTIAWLRAHQHADGSFGARDESLHDRMISTLASVNALTALRDEADQGRISRALDYVAKNGERLRADGDETIGFELLFPSLLEEAKGLGHRLPFEVFAWVGELGKKKLSVVPPSWIYGEESPLIHSIEFLGKNAQPDRLAQLVSVNGSIGNSPSASAFVYGQTGDPRLEAYLRQIVDRSEDGGVCNVQPFEIFETAWVYFNLQLAGITLEGMRDGLREIEASFKPQGVGISRDGLMPDADDSALAANVLARAGRPVSLQFLDFYQAERGFLCFPYERNPSVSTNIHILDALRAYDPREVAAHTDKILAFLRDVRQENAYWKDKWHASPFYTTAHAILALRGLSEPLVNAAVDYLLESQRSDGSWGIFRGTAEETAYCVQALTLALPYSFDVDKRLARASEFLNREDVRNTYAELWIGKGLYAPTYVIDATILSARALYQRWRGAHEKG
ncbi:prenyltransferase/squalene oxidase repeat-containing protein [Ferroacidibacillus organovorans]|uniref:Squalene cyclase C-terminal domain-containing protein n=1 Tax=Ferroacidibacillus organovorans TaxID=1765683 RepID=A0A101XT58_9BACL|nr:prenyltransferase/squalene oxidase repeat-containing protein [Ferroacidibacillus organovorans]KUO97104.1 hypothetical protein ATW55_12390 [Ferroacidibacillus organovorans]